MLSRSGEEGDRDWGERLLGVGQTSSRSAVGGPGGVPSPGEVSRLPCERKRLLGWLVFLASILRLILRSLEPEQFVFVHIIFSEQSSFLSNKNSFAPGTLPLFITKNKYCLVWVRVRKRKSGF